MVYHVYKNRRGRYSKVKVWSYVDLGTCRSEDIFMTDYNNEIIPVEKMKIITYLDDNEEVAIERTDVETGEIL